MVDLIIDLVLRACQVRVIEAVPTDKYLSPVTSKRLVRPCREVDVHTSRSRMVTNSTRDNSQGFGVGTPRTTVHKNSFFPMTGTTSKTVSSTNQSVVSFRDAVSGLNHCQN